jgi:hypothetical protein
VDYVDPSSARLTIPNLINNREFMYVIKDIFGTGKNVFALLNNKEFK